MKLTKFRIQHYKSIVDSGYCSLADDFTILIGKNESGKTSILEALRDFDREQYVIPEEAYPLSSFNEEPSLEMVFQITQQELESIEESSGLSIKREVKATILKQGITLVKSSLGEYKLPNDYMMSIFDDAEQNTNDVEQSPIEIKKQQLDKLLAGFPTPDLVLNGDDDVLQKSIKELRSSVKSCLSFIKDEQKSEQIIELLREIVKDVNGSDRQKLKRSIKATFIGCLVERIPRFVFFSDLNYTLPFSISIAEIKKNQAVLDVIRLTGLDLDVLMQTQEVQKRINFLNRYSVTVSNKFMDQWGQNKIEIIMRPEGDKILFAVKEYDKTDFFKLEQRSKGFQWFLSFFLRLSSFQSNNVVILIDELGMHLHPKAQKDILKMLSDNSNDSMQVIFSTHSSSLIDTEHLDRIRLVLKNTEKGSIIEDQIHEGIDHETFMPIQTALNSGQSTEIPSFDEYEAASIVPEDEENKEEVTLEEENQVSPIQEEVKKEESEESEESEDSEDKEEEIMEKVKDIINLPSEKDFKPKRRSLFGLFKKREEAPDEQKQEKINDSVYN